MENLYFKWDKNLVTGVDEIDDQHRQLIEIINSILQLSFENQTIYKETIEELYTNLSNYVVNHFETEKNIMLECSIDLRHFNTHCQVHSSFIETFERMFDDYEKLTKPSNLSSLSNFLIRWLAYHILDMDMSMVRQLHYINSENMSPEEAYFKEESLIKSSSEPLLKALQSLYYVVYEKNVALTQANLDLEEKIIERTKELIFANQKLEEVATRDELTGLANRRYAMSEIDHLINNWKRYEAVFSIIYIDVDKFKAVNDNFGHEYGDIVLKWIADFLRSNTRKNDIPCRIGGDEFIIICNNCNAESAFSLGKKLIQLSQTYNKNQIENLWNPSLSIGVAEITNNCDTINDILKKADNAMYLSKKKGGGNVSLGE